MPKISGFSLGRRGSWEERDRRPKAEFGRFAPSVPGERGPEGTSNAFYLPVALSEVLSPSNVKQALAG